MPQRMSDHNITAAAWKILPLLQEFMLIHNNYDRHIYISITTLQYLWYCQVSPDSLTFNTCLNRNSICKLKVIDRTVVSVTWWDLYPPLAQICVILNSNKTQYVCSTNLAILRKILPRITKSSLPYVFLYSAVLINLNMTIFFQEFDVHQNWDK